MLRCMEHFYSCINIFSCMEPTIKTGLIGGVGGLFAVALFAVFAGYSPLPTSSPSGASLAASPEAAAFHLDFGEQLAASNCNTKGAPVVNVVQKINNTVDSGEAGNYWGFDSFNRTIQVWQTGESSYCAMVRYEGKFAGIAGQTSPGGTGTLSGNETGVITGGYKATIDNATLLASPTWSTKGNVGTFDYQCDSSGTCPGAVNWLDQYFAPGYLFDQPWWGWIYRAGAGKVWVNASSGNQGDII